MSTFSVQGLPSSTSGAAHEKVPTWRANPIPQHVGVLLPDAHSFSYMVQ